MSTVFIMDTVINEIIQFLNRIYRFKYSIHGVYSKKNKFGQSVMVFYERDTECRYLIKIQPIYVIHLNTLCPTESSPIQIELPTHIKILLEKNLPQETIRSRMCFHS